MSWYFVVISKILQSIKTHHFIYCIILFSIYLDNQTMPKITYIEHNGKSHTLEVANGLTVMEGAVQNNIPGIDADCGGSCACATCHVYVDEKWFKKLANKDSAEEDMLDMAFEPKKFSRLSCQLTVSDVLDGLVVKMPSKQG
jgi:2Fe-2S ferredoxin